MFASHIFILENGYSHPFSFKFNSDGLIYSVDVFLFIFFKLFIVEQKIGFYMTDIL